MADAKEFGEKETTIRLKKFRQAIPNFLRKVEESLNDAEDLNKTFNLLLKKQKQKRLNLSKLATMDDPDEVIDFIQSLD